MLFHEGNAPEKRASLSLFSPDHGVGSDREASKSYFCMIFFFTMAKMVQRTCCEGVQFTPSNQVCTKKPPNKELTRIFHFKFAALALQLKLLFRKMLLPEKYQFG